MSMMSMISMISMMSMMSIVLPSAPAGTLAAPARPPTPIFGGEEASSAEWAAVASIEIRGALCTGVLVDRRVVLTAAHCLADRPPLSAITIRFGNNVQTPDVVAGVERYGIHPRYCSSQECGADRYDFAFLQLDKEHPFVPVPAVVADQELWDETMREGRTITAVGFGYDEADTLGVKRRVEATITGLSPLGLEFSAGGDGIDTCQGDSGGPVFARRDNGEFVLAGLTSRGKKCGTGGVYTAIYPGLCWLQEQTRVDLRAPECAACDCIDTRDPSQPVSGCRVRRDPDDSGPTLLLLCLLAWRRDRVRASRSPRA